MKVGEFLEDGRARAELLSRSVDSSNNSLWNYVSILSWLRALRAIKIILIIFPAVFGGLASWYALQPTPNAHMAAAFAALAGFFPIVFVALGLDERIGYYKTLAGKYRLIHSQFENISTTSARYDDSSLEAEYDRAFGEYCRVREEAHTVPRWCFVRTKKAIEAGEYSLLAGPDARLFQLNLKAQNLKGGEIEAQQAVGPGQILNKETPRERG